MSCLCRRPTVVKIETCEFPDDLLYNGDGLVWVREEPDGDVVVGITSIQAAVAGRLTRVEGRPLGVEYAEGKTIGTLESDKFFGPIRTPVAGTLIAVNSEVVRNPKLLTSVPYAEGWFARIRPSNPRKSVSLKPAAEARHLLASQIAALRVHCFAAFPDYELVEIGTECVAVLARLDDLIARAEVGDVIHLVSDDWTAPAEMVNWSLRTSQALIESRKEGNLYHFLVRKVS
jgi:glycine cleavage system H lipoate-binding protein/TusA-related sulfurtransferase